MFSKRDLAELQSTGQYAKAQSLLQTPRRLLLLLLFNTTRTTSGPPSTGRLMYACVLSVFEI